MKELYLGLVVVAFILLILSITVESSLTGNGWVLYDNKQTKPNTTAPSQPISTNELKNTFPERAYNKNNLDDVFLRKYYNNKYHNNFNAKNKFYISN
jgi:hypothetical protein